MSMKQFAPGGCDLYMTLDDDFLIDVMIKEEIEIGGFIEGCNS